GLHPGGQGRRPLAEAGTKDRVLWERQERGQQRRAALQPVADAGAAGGHRAQGIWPQHRDVVGPELTSHQMDCGVLASQGALAPGGNTRSIPMLELTGKSYGNCDGVTRRSFLKIGSLGLAGLTLPDLLRLRAAEAAAGKDVADTAVIQLWCGGGPTQIETYDPKPDAPAEYRGPFKPIRTKVSGIDICEVFPRQAQLADKFAIIRSCAHKE